MVPSSLLWVSGLQSLLITHCSSKTFLGMHMFIFSYDLYTYATAFEGLVLSGAYFDTDNFKKVWPCSCQM